MAQRLFIVDVESTGPTPHSGVMTEFGVVDFDRRDWFHGHLWDSTPHPDVPARPVLAGTAPNPWVHGRHTLRTRVDSEKAVFEDLAL